MLVLIEICPYEEQQGLLTFLAVGYFWANYEDV